MAAAAAVAVDDDFNETEGFDEYNPHPYSGGYDIALTYGSPLPPSPSTCYPPSSPASAPPPPDSNHRPKPSSPLPLPPPPLVAAPSPPPLPSPPPPSDHRPLHDYTDYRPEPYSPDLNLLGSWPFLAPEDGRCCRCHTEDSRYWGPWRRAASFLFGYSQGYGERRIGVDSYGIPIYACKKEGDLAITCQVEPAADGTLEYCEDGRESRIVLCDEKEERYGYGYDRQCYQEPLSVREDSTEMTLHQGLGYHEVYDGNAYPQLEWDSSYRGQEDESNFYGTLQHSYERHYKEENLCVELEPYKPTWSQNLSYHEVSDGEDYFKSNWDSSCRVQGDENNFHGSPQRSYERHYKEEAFCTEFEPHKPTWSQNISYHKAYDGKDSFVSNWNSSNIEREDKNITYGNPQHAYERHYNEQPLCVELDPYKPTWSQKLSYHFFDGEASLESNWSSMCNETMDNGNILGDPINAYESHYYEEPLCAQLEPFMPAWSQNPSFYELYMEKVDDS